MSRSAGGSAGHERGGAGHDGNREARNEARGSAGEHCRQDVNWQHDMHHLQACQGSLDGLLADFPQPLFTDGNPPQGAVPSPGADGGGQQQPPAGDAVVGGGQQQPQPVGDAGSGQHHRHNKTHNHLLHTAHPVPPEVVASTTPADAAQHPASVNAAAWVQPAATAPIQPQQSG